MAEVPTPILDRTFTNDGFWPDVGVRDLAEQYRLTDGSRDQMLRAVIVDAMADVNEALAEAQAQAIADGFATLDAFNEAHPGKVIDGQPIATVRYLSAVGYRAKAKVVKHKQATQQRLPSDNETTGADNTEQHFLDESQRAIARLMKLMAPAVPVSENDGVYVAMI